MNNKLDDLEAMFTFLRDDRVFGLKSLLYIDLIRPYCNSHNSNYRN